MAVQDIMCTSELTHDYKFSWIIEKFSLSPDVIRGPSITSIPGFKENLYLELRYKKGHDPSTISYYIGIEVFLVDCDVKHSHSAVISSWTELCDSKGNLLEQTTNSSSEFKGNINLLDYAHYTDFYSFRKREIPTITCWADDKIMVRGKLSISGINIPNSPIKAYRELSNDFKTIYESGISSDITFFVNEKTLRAHKIILLGRSPVFAKMLDNDMLESNSKKVVIEDTDFHSFNRFLMFLYTGILEEEDEKLDTMFALYSLAQKYQVNSLHSACSRTLGKNLAIDSVCSVLVLSDLLGDIKLKNVALVFIGDHFNQIAFTPEWVKMIIDKPRLAKEVQTYMASQTTKE